MPKEIPHMDITAKGSSIPIKCFLIDDDKDDQEIFSMALQDIKHPIRCFFADDGVEAIEKFNSDLLFLPDFIFMDINMPRMNGIECLELLKKLQRIQHIPVYMISTSADPKIIARAKAIGAIDFIVKPSSISVLTQLLAERLNLNLNGDLS